MSENTTPTPVAVPKSSAFSRQAALIGGGLGLVAIGALATVMVLGGSGKGDSPYMDATAPATQSTDAQAGKTGKTAAKVAQPAAAPKKVAAAPECASCGVVESVTPVQQKGEGTGIGAVAGGVLGGVLGHQVGGGDGKKLATVVGAVGGGLAGNEIEKRQRATTVYQVKVRMADGSLHTVTQAQSLTVGQKVLVDGQQLKPQS